METTTTATSLCPTCMAEEEEANDARTVMVRL